VGAGESRVVATKPIIERAAWMPDGRRVLIVAHEPNRGTRLYLVDLRGGEPRPITPEGFQGSLVSPDGRFVLVTGPDRRWYLYPIAGGTPQPLDQFPKATVALAWTPDGQSLLWYRRDDVPIWIMKFDIKTGRSALWKEIPVPRSDVGILTVRTSADGKSYAYSIYSDPGDVYLLEGIR
jgi:Tol biopolymer transport system component